MITNRHTRRAGFSLLEIAAVVAILGIIGAIIVPHVSASNDTAIRRLDARNRAKIKVEAERWYIEKGAWPATNLSDIGADPDYFRRGVPTNPTDGSAYTLDDTTHRAR